MGKMVKYMDYTQVGAPQMGNLRGQMPAVLDTLLLNGFNYQAPQSITQFEGRMTVSYGVAHGYVKGQVILISGANQQEYNAEFRVDTVPTSNTLTCKINTDPITPATGTFATKVAPLDWEKPFFNATKHAYRSKDPTSTKHILMLEDRQHPSWVQGWGIRYRVSVLSDMVDINTPVIDYYRQGHPDVTGTSGSSWWYQRRRYNYTDYGVNNGNTAWTLVGDGKRFYFIVSWHQDYVEGVGASIYFFGDFKPYYAGDEYRSALTCRWVNDDANGISYASEAGGLTIMGQNNGGFYAPRPLLALGNAISSLRPTSVNPKNNTWWSGRDTWLGYPNAYTGGLVVAPIYLMDDIGMRGEMYGINAVLSDVLAAHNAFGGLAAFNRTLHTVVQGGVEKLFVLVAYGADNYNGYFAYSLEDSWE